MKIDKILYWLPRSLAVLMILFISIFALDSFDGKSGIFEQLAAFFIHLIPSFILLVVLILSWKCEWIGAVLFTAAGIYYSVIASGRFSVYTILVISGPLILTGILFTAGWIKKAFSRG